MRKREARRRRWRPLGRSATRRLLSLLTCALILSGCAAKQPPPSVLCPEPAPVPAQLKESSLPDAQIYSRKVSIWAQKVQDFLKELR